MTNKTFVYKIIFFLVLVLALFTRFENLGNMPLSNQEAIPALVALDNGNIHSSLSDNQPLYTFLTSLLFDFFGDNNFTARFFPALAGVALILIISVLDKKIGRMDILLSSLLIVFDPVFLSLSRQADSRIFLFLFLISLIAFLLMKKYVVMGICMACLALSGVYFWHLMAIGLFFGLYVYYVNKKHGISCKLISNLKDKSKLIGCSFLISFAIICSRFFSTPYLFEGFLQSFVDYFGGWLNLSEAFNRAPLILMIFFSEFPLYFLAGLYEGIQSLRTKESKPRYLFTLFFITSIITLSYPMAQRVDVIFILPFFICGLAKYLIRLSNRITTDLKTSALIALPLVILLCLFWFLVLHQLNIVMGESEIKQLFILFIGLIFVFCLIIILSSWGWSITNTFMGLNIAILLIIGIFHLSQPLHILGFSPDPEFEVWWIGNYFKDADKINKIIKNISITNGVNDSLDIYFDQISLPSMEWLFRNYEIKALDRFTQASSPSIIISKNSEFTMIVPDQYYGNTFNLEARSAWILNFPKRFFINDYIKWLLIRKNDVQNSEYYYWVHKDLLSSDNTIEEVNK